MYKMRSLLKTLAGLFLLSVRDFLNIFFNLREMSVLVYHSIDNTSCQTSVSPKVFNRQLDYLIKNNYYFASLDEIVKYIDGKVGLPTKTVALTFDDGYESFFSCVMPLIENYKIPVSLFLISDVEHFSSKSFSNDLALLNKEQLHVIKNNKLISLQSHSMFHQDFRQLDEVSLKEEIVGGKAKLENDLALNTKYFAYPGGVYTDEAVKITKKAGFDASFSIKAGLVHRGDDKLLIKRNVILKSMHFWQFRMRLTKAIEWYRKLGFLVKGLATN